jgi:hypothetical protein
MQHHSTEDAMQTAEGKSHTNSASDTAGAGRMTGTIEDNWGSFGRKD